MSIFHKLNVGDAAREHARKELIDKLVHDGKAHVKGIGTWQFSNYQITFYPDEGLVKEVRDKRYEAMKAEDAK